MTIPPVHDEPAVFIERRSDLEGLCRELAGCERVALDSEANSMHAYREQTCIVQLSTDDRNAILDVIAIEDLSPLRTLLDRSSVEVVLHGGDYDIRCLTRDHDFRFHDVFDTMIAATLLGDERVGLADLVAAHYGDTLEKRFQRADWARRPLSSEQIDYLRRDTLYLPGLRNVFAHRLEEADLLEEAAIEFRRLAGLRGQPIELDREGWRRIKGARKLDDTGRCVLHALHQWRESEAERRDVPPFKVISPRAMLNLAAQPPRRAHHPRTLPFLSHRERARYGRAIVAAVQQGLRDHGAGEIPRRDIRPTLPPGGVGASAGRKRREEALRAWRKREATKRKVPNVVVLPNPALLWLAETRPTTREALAACTDIGPKRIERYGKALLAVLDRPPPTSKR